MRCSAVSACVRTAWSRGLLRVLAIFISCALAVLSLVYLLTVSHEQIFPCGALNTLVILLGLAVGVHVFITIVVLTQLLRRQVPGVVDWRASVGLPPPKTEAAPKGRRGYVTPLCVTRVARITLTAAFVLAILLVDSAAIIRLWLGDASIRPALSSLSLPGLSQPVSITYSAMGVPHIVANNEADLWYAQGAVHARDRLWQIEFQRRVAIGGLSALVGKAGRDADTALLVLGVSAAAARDAVALAANSPTVFAALQRFTDGVNDFVHAGTGLDTGRPKPGGALSAIGSGYVPLEHRLLGVTTWKAYSPTEALAWGKVTSWTLAGNLDSELQRLDMLNAGLSVARINELKAPFNTTRFPTVLSAADLGLGHGGPGVGAEAAPSESLPESVAAQLRALAGNPSPLVHPAARALGARLAGTLGKAEDEVDSLLQASQHRVQMQPLSSIAAAAAAPWPIRVLARGLDAVVLGATALSAWRGAGTCGASGRGGLAPLKGLLRQNQHSGVRNSGASNNWVINGSFTPSRLPLLSNDPHLQLLAPSLWTLGHLQCEAAGINVVGASFVGVPAVVIGRNARIAWGVTNTGVDVQDVYMLDTAGDPSGATYAWAGGRLPFTIRTEVMRVKGEADVSLPVRVSRYGPVISDFGVYEGYGSAPLALRWVQTDPAFNDTLLRGVYDLQRAANWTSFRAALAFWTGPSQNVVYADVEGNIGYQMPGVIPLRNVSAGHTGAFPVPGLDATFDWLGVRPFDSLPRTLNPPEGFIVSANNQVPPPGAMPGLSADWDETNGYRALRITRMLQALVSASSANGKRLVTSAAMQRIQADVTSGFARDVLGPDGPAVALPPSAFGTLAGAALRDTLVRWVAASPEAGGPVVDVGMMEATSWAGLVNGLARLGASTVGTPVYLDSEWLLRALSSDAAPGGSDPACALFLGFSPSAPCTVALAYMFEASASRFGTYPPAWGGAIHQTHITHAVLDGSMLGCMAGRVAQHGGDDFTPNVGHWDKTDSAMTMTHGPSYRQVVDLADAWGASAPASVFIQPMGQGGDLLDESYAAFLPSWAARPALGYVEMGPRLPSSAEGAVIVVLNPA